MIEQELKDKIISKIKDSKTEQKPHLTALYHRLLELYGAEEILNQGTLVVNGRRSEKINTYAKTISEIADGKTEVGTTHLGDLTEFFTEDEAKTIESKARPVQNYWLKAFKAHEALKGFITDADEPLLGALQNVSLEVSKTNDDYSITFAFKENEYISNSTLTLKVHVDKNEDCSKIESDDVQWKAGKDLTEKMVSKTQTNKKTKKKRTVEKKQKCDSFFQFFKTRTDEDEEEYPEEDDEEGEGMEGFYDCSSIGDALSVIKYMILKYHAPTVFDTHIAEYDFEGGDDFGGFGGDDEDRDDDDEDDEPEEKPTKGKKKKGGAGPAGGAEGAPKQEECKKQ